MSLLALNLFFTEYQVLVGLVLGMLYTLLIVALSSTRYGTLWPWVASTFFITNWLGLAWIVQLPEYVISRMFVFGLIGLLATLILLGWLLKPRGRLVAD